MVIHKAHYNTKEDFKKDSPDIFRGGDLGSRKLEFRLASRKFHKFKGSSVYTIED